MNKKDTITKVKALNEFIQLLIASPLTETVCVLLLHFTTLLIVE